MAFELPPDFYTAVGISSLLAGLAAVVSLVITLRQDRDARLLGFMSETSNSISRQLENEKSLKELEDCIVYAYNFLDILDGVAFLRIRNKIPEYAVRYYKSFFEYGITIMAWYASIPEKEGSSKTYDTRSLSDNWPSLVDWLRGESQMNAYGIELLPPRMVDELNRCKVDKSAMFDKVRKSTGEFKVV